MPAQNHESMVKSIVHFIICGMITFYKIVLEDIRKHAKIVENCEQDFIEAVTEFKLKKQKEQCLKNEKILKSKAQINRA